MRLPMLRAFSCVVLLGLCARAASAAPSFSGLGDLPGLNDGSFASAVTPDGSVVVGVGTGANGLEPFRWTQAGGMVGLGKLAPGDADVTATGVSNDGSVVVGRSGNQAYRWTEAGMVGLGLMPPEQPGEESVIGTGQGVSADGSQVVGWNLFNGPCESGEFGTFCLSRTVGFTWTQAGGFVSIGPNIPYDVATGADVIVGAGAPTGALFAEAFRLDPVNGMQMLGHVPGLFRSTASAVSADGGTVVGYAEVSNTTPWQAFRWTAEDGMVGLGNLPSPGLGGGQANGVSGDGSIVVGFSPTFGVGQAFIWDEVHGMRALAQVLTEELGLDLTGWNLTNAQDISADGQTIVGWGTNPDGQTEAWIATIPEPSSALLLGAGVVALGVLRLARPEATRAARAGTRACAPTPALRARDGTPPGACRS